MIEIMEDDFKLYILFNKLSRQMTSFTFDISVFPPSIINNLLIKEYRFKDIGIPDEKINLNRFKWVGDFDTGHLVDLVTEKKSVVTEKEMNDKTRTLFYRKYDIDTILFQLVLNTPMHTVEGNEMQSFLRKILDKKKKDIEFFQNSDLHIWETEHDEKKRQEDAFKI
jgi:hypothetical protein